MGLMILEHFALQVPDPAAMADWYVAHLGFRIARSSGEPSHARFLMARGECVMLELYCNPTAAVPDYSELSPVLLHIAYLSENLPGDRDRLLRAGAKLVEDYVTSPNGDQFVMLRDPWGLPLQLAKRGTPMLPKS